MISFAIIIAFVLLLAPVMLSIYAAMKASRLEKSFNALEKTVSSLEFAQRVLATRVEEAEKRAEADTKRPDHPSQQIDAQLSDQKQKTDEPDEEEPLDGVSDEQETVGPDESHILRPTSVPSSPHITSTGSDAEFDPPLSAKTGTMEQALGTKLSVWLGGLALALGGVFLVKHSIEQGYLTPEVRILLGALFSTALLAAGEFLRRHDINAEIAGISGAYIPGAITAAGIMTGFATVYAAYAIYQFLDATAAFVLLAAVSFSALAFSSIHGPALAAMGLAGSYVTPMLVSTDDPRAWALFLYLLFVTAASYFTAQARGWLWLAIGATAGSVVWGFIWYATNWQVTDVTATSVYILTLLALALVLLRMDESEEEYNATTPVRIAFPTWFQADWPVSLCLTAIGVLAVSLLHHDAYTAISMAVFVITIGLFLASAWQWRSLTVLAPLGAILFSLAILTWHISVMPVFQPRSMLLRDLGLVDLTPPELTKFLSFCAAFAIAFGVIGFFASYRRGGDLLWALTSAVVPLITLVYTYWRATRFEHSISFGIIAIILAGLATATADTIDRTRKGRLYELAGGIYAVVAVSALALAFTILLEKGWLTIALAMITPALAFIARHRQMPVLRYMAAAIAIVTICRIALEPRIVGDDLGTTPLLNWLLYGYGVPALAMAVAASVFRKQRDDWTVALLEAAAILFTVALAFLQIRHWMHGGNVYSSRLDLAELGLHTSVWLALSLGYQQIKERTGRIVADYAATLLGLAGFASILFGHLLSFNPLFSNAHIGYGRVFNDLLLGYALPALLCALVYWRTAGKRHRHYVLTAGLCFLALLFTYISLEVRTLFQGPRLGLVRHTSDAEWYSYSAAWLVFGVLVLSAGTWLKHVMTRYVGLALVSLAIVKVFLWDMSQLTGLLRALSFIGLGLALVGIGFLYQKVIFPPAPTKPADNDEAVD